MEARLFQLSSPAETHLPIPAFPPLPEPPILLNSDRSVEERAPAAKRDGASYSNDRDAGGGGGSNTPPRTSVKALATVRGSLGF